MMSIDRGTWPEREAIIYSEHRGAEWAWLAGWPAAAID